MANCPVTDSISFLSEAKNFSQGGRMDYAIDSSDLYGRSPLRNKKFYVVPGLVFVFWLLKTWMYGFPDGGFVVLSLFLLTVSTVLPMYIYHQRMFVRISPCTCVIRFDRDGQARLKRVFTDLAQWEWWRREQFFKKYPAGKNKLYTFGSKVLTIQTQWSWASGVSSGRGVVVPLAIIVQLEAFGQAGNVVSYLNKRQEEAWSRDCGVTDEDIAELVRRKVYAILYATPQAFYHAPDKNGHNMAQTVTNALTRVLSDWGLTLLYVEVINPPATIIS